MRPVRPPFLPPYPAAINGNFGAVAYRPPGSGHSHMHLSRGEASQQSNVAQVPSKSTTLWVGKIAATVEADFVRKLLEFCGMIKEWKPATDAKTGAMKGFGFCTYQHPEGVMVALEVLNGLLLDGQSLSLKCNSATESYISWYKSSKSDGGQSDPMAALSDSIESTRQKIKSCLEGRPSTNQAATESNLAASNFLESLAAETVTHPAQERQKIEKDEIRNVSVILPKPFVREMKREREQLREYRNLLRRWEEHERKLWRSIEIHKEKDRDLRLERRRQIHADNENFDSDEEQDYWNRKYYYKSREAVDRRYRREQEMRQDTIDQEREQKSATGADKGSQRGSPAGNDIEKDLHHDVADIAGLTVELGVNETEFNQDESASLLAKRKVPKVVPFDEDHNEKASASRKLIPITYTEEEMQVGTSQSKILPVGQSSVEQQRQRLIGLVPKTKEGVFSYDIKWNLLDGSQDTCSKLTGWVNRKIGDLLGTDNQAQGFADFIIGEVFAHCKASQLLDSIVDVLDEDAEPLVLQLYKLIIYQTEELASKGC